MAWIAQEDNGRQLPHGRCKVLEERKAVLVKQGAAGDKSVDDTLQIEVLKVGRVILEFAIPEWEDSRRRLASTLSNRREVVEVERRPFSRTPSRPRTRLFAGLSSSHGSSICSS